MNLSPAEVGDELTRVGLAVEGIHPHGEDFVFDIDLTSNRPDCLSHLGVARELSVSTQTPLNALGDTKAEVPVPAVLAADIVRIDSLDLCQRFTARIIRNLKIGPSPRWLVDRLEAIGERSINNVADITNYVMHELGQPMHSFDLDKLEGSRIVVRRAANGEAITTLDEVVRTLDSTMLAICDAEKPIAVAGVMGGLRSSITDDTVNVLLEVACFDRQNIRATSRNLNLATEASYRFERGVDIDNLIRASNRATELICELAGGTAGDLVDIYPQRSTPIAVTSENISAAVKRLTGLTVDGDDCIRILSALGIAVQTDDSETGRLTFASPSWRHDIAIEEDLVEEIARHTGYENIVTELPPAYGAGEYQATEPREKLLRQCLVDLGANEALSYSFIDTKFDGIYETAPGVLIENTEEPYITLQDSVIEGAVRMRTSILPGLLEAVRLNLNHQRRDLRLFELGKCFAAGSGDEGLPNEQKLLSIVITGDETHEGRASTVRELDFYDAKGMIDEALDAAGITGVEYSSAHIRHLRGGQTASIRVNGTAIGSVGRLNDEIASSFKFKQPIYVAEINLDLAFRSPVEQIVYRPLGKYPGVVRDVSFVVQRDVTFKHISDAIAEQNFELCRSVVFVDIYEGKGLEVDERSITVRIEYRSDERTLVETEIEPLHTEIISETERKLGIKMRY